MDPYIRSSVDIIDKIIGKENRRKLEEQDIIVVEALAYIRGSSIDNSILVMEEVQNMSPEQVKTLLTRIGENTKFILSGDLDQSDRYRDVEKSGLFDAMKRHKNVEEIGFFEFEKEDIVRNPIITKILNNYKTVNNDVPKPTPPKNRKIKEGELPPPRPGSKKEITPLRKLKIFFKRNFKF
jgi:phosphate starvation-inducible PhoH-like protein